MSSKKEKIYIAIIILLIGTAAQSYYSFVYAPANDIQVYYNQDHALNTKVINTIREADKFVYFSIYTFTRQDIAQALLAAKYRGLEVKGLTDKNQYANSTGQKKIIEDLRKAGIPVYFQDHFAIMHMKVLVTEKAYLSGSFNWTSAGTNLNDEVLEIGTAENVRKQYQNILEEVFKKYKPNTPS
jgi:phosphatidylserine/phosphatidylglycerophosphate/cardiolipin synthase-like enzyme